MGDFDCCAKPTPEHALDEANWKLAQIRDAVDWPERSSIKVVAIREILNGPEWEPTA